MREQVVLVKEGTTEQRIADHTLTFVSEHGDYVKYSDLGLSYQMDNFISRLDVHDLKMYVGKVASQRHEIANRRYDECYDNMIYEKAGYGYMIEERNTLIDDAMALCGSPYHAMSQTGWSMNALRFLRLFT